ncbi:hypothetical protein NLJ89_g4451 [Agrocybe chaxingu]|uniref:Uncharacterized protein n=1 Tax=Agrocybe chaxingu TaxID=84603 RepID=A0A9W8MY01_9AGAR|nr:hypothetical protein NLJ89_g4451 [Agrocybe chaxingu]
MENTAVSTKSRTRMQTSFSANSLDIGQQLASAKCPPPSLMSESVTLDSLSTRSSDALPPFPNCRSPQIATIALGDHLKMFSEVLSNEPGFSVEPAVLLAAPTSPRLKVMLKECLSIRKWASVDLKESSTDWHAPGHIPWESIDEERATSWIPEGSLFSPEGFSRALSEARTRRVSTSSIQPPPSDPRLSHGSIDGDILDMVRELKGLRSFFEDSLQTENTLDISLTSQTLAAPSLPALVVSTSQFTFPLPLDSSQSISQHTTPSLAHRRGRKAPTPLRLKMEHKPPELSYPEVPTAFLGSPTRHVAHYESAKDSNTPALRVEDMITNLRLQCSTMALNTPPVDSSWNSRSVIKSSAGKVEGLSGTEPKPDGDEWAFAESLYRASDPPVVSPTSTQHLRSPTSPRSCTQGRKHTTHTSLPTPQKRKVIAPPKKPDDARIVRRSEVQAPPLRSAMVRQDVSHAKKPWKSVRFALPQSEVEKSAVVNVSNPTPIKQAPTPPKVRDKAGTAPSARVKNSSTPPKSTVVTPPRKPGVVRRATSGAVLRNKTNDAPPAKDAAPEITEVTPRPRRSPDGRSPVRAHSVIVSSPPPSVDASTTKALY